jgi:NADP-dependent 3-hydroxy acid dehydrogenase YdfG
VGNAVIRWLQEHHSSVTVLQLVRSEQTKVVPGCEPVKGDLGKPLLGVGEEAFAALRERVSLVVHCGAQVNLVARYSSLRRVNVLGSLEVLRLGRPVRFVSSSSAHDSASEGYGMSKLVAERAFVHAAERHGANTVVVRPADIAGRGALHDHRFITLRHVVEAGGEMPDVSGWRWRAVEVEEVVKALLYAPHQLPPPLVCDIATVARWLRDAKYAISSPASAADALSLDAWVGKLPTDSEMRVLLANGVLEGLMKAVDPHEEPGEETRPYPKELFEVELSSARERSLFPAALPLIGQCAVVTGASSGIGSAIALRLLEGGARVMLLSRRGIAAAEIMARYQAGREYEVGVCDVTDSDAVRRAVERCRVRLGAPTVVVNNAGVMYYTLMRNGLLAQWKQTIDTICHGTSNLLHATLPHLLSHKKPGRAHFISITSDAGKRPFAGLAVYSGAKHFVEAVTSAMRLEFVAEDVSKHVRVTNIQPGNVATPLLGMTTDEEAMAQYGTPSGCRVLDPDDIARAVVYAITQPSYCSVNEMLVEPRLEPI